MIYKWGRQAVVALENGGVVMASVDSPSWLSPPCLEGIAIKQTSCAGGLLAILTNENRFLVCASPENSPRDITSEVQKIFGEPVDIISVSASYSFIIVRSMCSIGLICMRLDASDTSGLRIKETSHVLHQASSEIDLWIMCQSQMEGVARTSDGGLFYFGYNDHNCYGKTKWGVVPLQFHETASIKELYCSDYYIMLLMQDGRVYVQFRRPDHTLFSNEHEPFELVIIPNCEPIRKIVIESSEIFYISVGGNCYHAGYLNDKWVVNPDLLQGLRGYQIEDIYTIRKDYVIQHDGMRLSILHVAGPKYHSIFEIYRDRKAIFDHYANGLKKPRPLSFFDNKTVISIENIHGRTRFITEEGHVYWSRRIKESIEPVFTLDPFFETQPLAVPSRALAIKSASSDPREEVIKSYS